MNDYSLNHLACGSGRFFCEIPGDSLFCPSLLPVIGSPPKHCIEYLHSFYIFIGWEPDYIYESRTSSSMSGHDDGLSLDVLERRRLTSLHVPPDRHLRSDLRGSPVD